MKSSFRQSMTWLHTWAGLLVGWVLYFVFLTGSLGYFDTELDYWMRPEAPRYREALPVAEAVAIARRRIDEQAPQVERFIVYPPSGRDIPELSVFWRALPDEQGQAASRSEVLDRATAKPFETRATGGGAALYQMHYYLHYMPTTTAYWIVGICTMFMLVAIVTGVIAHKRIFRDFFTFRPKKGQRSWLDAHNVLGVLALPFHLMISYSGLVFFCFTYTPLIVSAIYGAGAQNRQTFFDEAFQNGAAVRRAGVAAPLGSLDAMTAEAERHWGPGQVRSVDVQYPGDANARVTFTRTHVTPTSNGDQLTFDGVSGRLLAVEPRSGPMLVNETMMSLHEGLFSGTALHWLYFLSGLGGTALIATGLVYWTTKRAKAAERHAGHALVERLNVGVIAGLPAAIAVYLGANRLLPVELADRASWEMNSLFIAWAALLLHAFVQTPRRAWPQQLGVAALLCAAVPVVNWLTTDRHLGATLPAADWALAGVDLVLLACAAAFAGTAYFVATRRANAPAVAAVPHDDELGHEPA